MKTLHFLLVFCLSACMSIGMLSCKKLKKYDLQPDLEPLRQGLETSIALGYCASTAASVFGNGIIPDHVTLENTSNSEFQKSGIIYIQVNEDNPLPFNSDIGQIIIAGLWDNNGGVLSIVFTDINLISGEFNFYGFHTIPVILDDDGKIITLFAKQDVVLGVGSDTLLNLSMSQPQFNAEIARLDEEQPDDLFVAASQNVWFVNVDRRNSYSDVYDDNYTINGGGQIAIASNTSGGIIYHAVIDAFINYYTCSMNPFRGTALIQNIKAGDNIDLGSLLLDFRETCDGRAFVDVATGKYIRSNKSYVDLNLN